MAHVTKHFEFAVRFESKLKLFLFSGCIRIMYKNNTMHIDTLHSLLLPYGHKLENQHIRCPFVKYKIYIISGNNYPKRSVAKVFEDLRALEDRFFSGGLFSLEGDCIGGKTNRELMENGP